MNFRRAYLSECKAELERLVNDHWVEINEYGSTESKIDWNTYDALEAANIFYLFVAEDSDGICGYDCYVVVPCLQNTDILQANTNGIFLTKNKRGKNIASRLLQFSEKQLRDVGVRSITAGVIPSKDYSPLLIALNYHAAETMFIKVLN